VSVDSVETTSSSRRASSTRWAASCSVSEAWEPSALSRRRVSESISRPARCNRSDRNSATSPSWRRGRLGLTLERPELPAHLSLEVLQPKQVLLAGFEATFSPLAAAAELKDSCSLLDHHSPVLRAGLENRVELTLADDHMLLAANSGIGKKLLNVEQPAGCAVERILALARAKKRPCDRDLRHVHW